MRSCTAFTGPFIVLELGSLPNVTRLDHGSYSQVAGAVQAQHGQQVKVVAANRVERQLLFHYQGHIGTYLNMDEFDVTGAREYYQGSRGDPGRRGWS